VRETRVVVVFLLFFFFVFFFFCSCGERDDDDVNDDEIEPIFNVSTSSSHEFFFREKHVAGRRAL
jgi:hypothetical protein